MVDLQPSSGPSSAAPTTVLADGGLLAETFASNYKITVRSDKKCKWALEYGGYLIKFCAKLCRLNFNQTFEPKRCTKPKEPWWSDLLLGFHLYFFIKLAVVIYYHFVLDYYKYKLDRFDQLIDYYKRYDSDAVRSDYASSFRRQLISDYESALSTLARFGAPYVQFHHLTEHILMYGLIAINATYMYPQAYYKLRRRFDYSIVGIVIAPGGLQEMIDPSIRDRVNDFIMSSRAFSEQSVIERDDERILSKWRQSHLRRRQTGDEPEEDCDKLVEHGSVKQAESNTTVRNHTYLVSQVKAMALSGQLQPFNRRGDWLSTIATIYGAASIFMLIFFAICFTKYIMAPPFVAVEVRYGPMDIVFLTEILIYDSTGFVAGVFYLTMVTVTCLDQVHLVSKLNQSIDEHMLACSHRLKPYLVGDAYRVFVNPCSDSGQSRCDLRKTSLVRKPHGGRFPLRHRIANSPTDTAARPLASWSMPVPDGRHLVRRSFDPIDNSLNVSLLHTLLHHKIFVKQLSRSFDPIPVVTTIVLLEIFLMPAITRLFIAYLDHRKKQASLLICVLMLVSCDMVLVAVCWMHARCRGVYRHLHSLLAHTISINHGMQLRTGRRVFDEHLVWLMRKELSDPDRFLDQFATQFLFGNSMLTYASLLRYHFWWGILSLSIMVIDQTSPSASDVFGRVLRFYIQADIDINQFLHNYTSSERTPWHKELASSPSQTTGPFICARRRVQCTRSDLSYLPR